MARMFTLPIEKRDMKIQSETLRQTGKLPAVFYGPKENSTPISVTTTEFKKVWKKAGESSVIILKDAKGAEHEVLIQEVDIHPLSGEPRHVDFYVIEKGKKVEVSVQLVFEGVAPAVKDKGGILVKVHREIEVKAEPRDLPHEIKIDISSLVELTDVIKVKNIIFPKGVEVKMNPEEVIASISVAKEEIEEAPAAIDMSAIEVEAKGKEVKEGEEGAPVTGDAKVGKENDKKPTEKKQEKK